MVSTREDPLHDEISTEKIEGLIGYLMRKRHGTPFEHSCLQFSVRAPIFVWREHHRHRIGFSFNEESARYKQLEPEFWVPRRDRKLMPTPDPGEYCTAPCCGKSDCGAKLLKTENGVKTCPNSDCRAVYEYHTSSRPHFGPATDDQYSLIVAELQLHYRHAYEAYEKLIAHGYAKEAARAIMPVGVYSSCWVTCNSRSLMHFLSLRVHDPQSMFVSHPQAEIELVAKLYEDILAKGWPITHKAFVENKRVAP